VPLASTRETRMIGNAGRKSAARLRLETTRRPDVGQSRKKTAGEMVENGRDFRRRLLWISMITAERHAFLAGKIGKGGSDWSARDTQPLTRPT
jgi:hypothetical protein